MSVVYEPRSFMTDGAYPSIGMGDEHDHGVDQRFTDNDVADQLSQYTEAAMLAADRAEAEEQTHDDKNVIDERTFIHDDQGLLDTDALTHRDAHQLDLTPSHYASPVALPLVRETLPDSKDSTPVGDSPRSSRTKNLPKPERPDVVKGADGKFHCTVEDCKEEVRSFNRKCEWNKHMDKHERPYRCLVVGCESLPGFTYSGGLLRHEREVHGKYGGPKKTVKCPHPNCKRHTGKGFSRQENLNEHLRRVHTDMDGASPQTDGAHSADGHSADDNDSVKSGLKRKRRSSDNEEISEIREEMKRMRQECENLRLENEKLRNGYQKIELENKSLKIENEQQSQHSLSMMQQIAELQEAVRHGMSGPLAAPTAQMI